jgi:hypothetical protein
VRPSQVAAPRRRSSEVRKLGTLGVNKAPNVVTSLALTRLTPTPRSQPRCARGGAGAGPGAAAAGDGAVAAGMARTVGKPGAGCAGDETTGAGGETSGVAGGAALAAGPGAACASTGGKLFIAAPFASSATQMRIPKKVPSPRASAQRPLRMSAQSTRRVPSEKAYLPCAPPGAASGAGLNWRLLKEPLTRQP